MSLIEYGLQNVEKKEYALLERQKSQLIKEVIDYLETSAPESGARRICVTYKYNPDKKMVGIFLGKGKKERPVFNHTGLSPIERMIVEWVNVSLMGSIIDIKRQIELSDTAWV